MIIFRFLSIVTIIYLSYLFNSGFGAGMEPVWVSVLIVSIVLSIKKAYVYLFGIKWFKRLFLVLLVTVTLVEGLILVTAFQEPSEEGYDYMIVLGAGLLGDRISLTLKYRLDLAYDYMIDHPEIVVVVSGGQGPGENLTEADAMAKYLVERGIASERIIREDQSTSTRENIAYSYEIFEALGLDEPEVLLVSSRFHLLRAIRIAKESGHTVDAIGSRTLLYLVPNYYFREMFAVVVEFLR